MFRLIIMNLSNIYFNTLFLISMAPKLVHANNEESDKEKFWLKSDRMTIRNNIMAEKKVNPNNVDIESRNGLTMRTISLSIAGCGESNAKTRIVGGQKAKPGAHPWIVVITHKDEPFCAGAIINSQWIITAAHCFIEAEMNIKNLGLLIGTNWSHNGTKVKVGKILLHPRFDVGNSDVSDIALIKTSNPLKLGGKVKAICVPPLTYSEPIETSIIVAGWGKIKYGAKSFPEHLQEITLPIISETECVNRYKTRNEISIFKSQICSWSKNKDACLGDSGGPAIQYTNGKAFLVGIVSFGITCADKYPGVYTKVSYYLHWIKNTMEAIDKSKKKG